MNELGLGLLFSAKDMASGVMGKVSKEMLDIEGRSSTAGQAVKKNFQDFSVGMTLFGAGLSGLALLNPATEAASKFGQGIAEITTLTNEASLGFDSVFDSVLNMNEAFGGGTQAQTKAMYDAISAGAANAAEATNLLTASNKLAVAGKTDVSTALDGLTSSINAYGASFQDAAEFSDVMFTAVQKGKTTIPELSAVIGRVAPTASALGVSFGELNAAFAAVTAKGLKTEEAATGIKAALSNIVKPSSDATAEASRLGIKFDAATVRSKGFATLLKDITSSSKFNADSLSKLFGSVEGLNAVLALTANGGTKFADALAAMDKSAGVTDGAFATMSEQLAFQEKRFDALKENALILIGDALVPIKQALVTVANSILTAFNAIPTPARNFLVQAFAAVSVLLTLVGGFIAAKAAIGLFAAGMSAVGVSVGGIAAAAGPALLVIGALVGLVTAVKYAIDKNIGGVGDTFKELVAGAHLFADALQQLFSEGALSGEAIEGFFKGNSAVNFAIKIYVIFNRIKAFIDGIADGFADKMGVVDEAIGNLIASVAPIGKVISGLFEANNADEATAKFNAFARAGQVVGGILAKVAAALLNVASLVGSLLSGAVSGVAQLGPIFSGVGDAFGDLFDALGELGNELGLAGDKGVSVGEIFFALGRGIAGVFGMAVGVVRGVVSAVASIIKGLASVIGGVVDVVGGIIDGDWSRVWTGAKKIVYGVVSAIVGALGGLVEGIASSIDAVGKVIGKDFGAAKAVAGFRKSLDANMKDFFGLGEKPAAAPGQPGAAPAVAVPGAVAAPTVDLNALPFAPTVANVAAAQAEATANNPLAPTVENLAAAVAEMKAAKSGQTVVQATMVVDGQVLGEVTAKAQASATAAAGGITPVQVQ